MQEPTQPPTKRTFRYSFTIECASDGKADLDKVEHMIDLAMQDLVYDEEFTTALGETYAVTIQTRPLLDK
jgi:hypothetical protein